MKQTSRTQGTGPQPQRRTATSRRPRRQVARTTQHIGNRGDELQHTRDNLQASIKALQSTNKELLAANEELQHTNAELHAVNAELSTANAEVRRMEQALAVRLEQLEAIRALAIETTQELDPAALLKHIIQSAVKLLPPASIGIVYLWDAASQTLLPQAWCNVGDWIKDICLRPGEGMVGTVAQRREGLSVDYYPQFPNAHPLFLQHLRQYAAMAEPLFYQEQLIGVIFLSSAEPHQPFTPQARQLLTLFAAQAAIVIENARLFRQAYERENALRQSNASLQREVAQRQQIEARFRTVIEASPSGLVLTNDRGEITLLNSQTELLFGYSREELYGQCVEILIPARFRDTHVDYRQHFLAAPTARAMGKGRSLYGRRKDGTEFPVEIDLTPIQSDGRAAVLSAIVGISERQHAEEALARQAQELLQKNQELNDFTRIASHDLQEPLRQVSAFSDMLRKDLGEALPARAAESLHYITEGVNRMRALVRDLLTLSYASQFDMTWTRLALNACVDTALQSLRLRVEETGATIERQPLPEIMGDATLLTQLYQNLLSNALKYQAKGPPVIRLTAEPQGDVWLLGVQDNGIGIDPAYAEYIFAPFKRLHSRAEYSGTGMGLAICRKVVERHGGRIWVESQPGQGATFSFTLPREDRPTAAERTVRRDKRGA